MTEEYAREWIVSNFGESAARKLSSLVDLVVAENEQQNLISPGSITSIWARHVVDSAQLLTLAPSEWTCWLDIGTGGGFPGLVVASLAEDRRVVMVEPRTRRAAFLQACVEALGLPLATVIRSKIETVALRADVISARAVSSVDSLLAIASHNAHSTTTWLLPRGRNEEQRRLRMFHVEHSITDPNSVILVGTGVGR